MFDTISQNFTKLNEDPLPLVVLIIVFMLWGIGSKLNKIIEHLAEIPNHARYTREAVEKSVPELERMEIHLGYIDDKITAVSNDYYPSRN